MKRSSKRGARSASRRKAAAPAHASYPSGMTDVKVRRAPRRLAANFETVMRGQLQRIRETLQLSGGELGSLFGVSRQAVDQWETKRVPVEQAAEIDRFAEVVDELGKRFKPQRLPVIVRKPMPILDNRTILQTLQTDGAPAMYEFFRRWSSYIEGIQPIRAGEYR